MTHEQADALLATLKAAYPHADNGIDSLQATARDALYRQTLLGWHARSAQEAIQQCLLSSRFYPTIAELYAAYNVANRPMAERQPFAPSLPKPGDTTASLDEVKAVLAQCLALVSGNVDVKQVNGTPIRPTPAASPEEERAAIQRTLRRAGMDDA